MQIIPNESQTELKSVPDDGTSPIVTVSVEDAKAHSQPHDAQKSLLVESSCGLDDSSEKQKPAAAPKKSRFIVKMVAKEVNGDLFCSFIFCFVLAFFYGYFLGREKYERLCTRASLLHRKYSAISCQQSISDSGNF